VTYDAYDKKRDLWTKRTTVTLGEFLKLQLGTSEHDRSMLVQFRTAVGTEPYLAKWMRGSGLFKFADLDPGGCDGMDRSYFAIDRGLLFEGNGLSQEKFGRYIEARLREFASQDEKGKAWQFRLGQSRMARINLPITPPPVAYRIRVYAASEVTRRAPGWWDTFWVTFEAGELMEVKPPEYPIVVTVDRLKSSKRSAGNSNPPDDAYFTKELELTDEAEVTAAIAQYFARRDRGRCVIQMSGDDGDKNQAVCNAMAAR
jgi:hypothetical protein